MPAALTHYIFSRDLVKNDKYKDIFLLGCQGPDTLFFYGYNIKKREDKKDVNKFGFYLHSINPTDLYHKMFAYAFSKEKEEKEMLIEFTRGFVYHYLLDRTIHPYVFYNTGFPYTKKKYNLGHGFFEGSLDTAIMTKKNCKVSNYRAIKANKKYVMACSIMLAKVANDLMQKEVLKEDTYYKAYKDFRLVRLVLDSKYGVKKAIFNKFFDDEPINTICQPHRIKDGIDYLNEEKRIWLNPTSGEPSDDSVLDLFKKVELDTRIIDNIICNYKDNIVTRKKIEKLVNNINHDGKPLDSNMRFFDIIYKKDRD